MYKRTTRTLHLRPPYVLLHDQPTQKKRKKTPRLQASGRREVCTTSVGQNLEPRLQGSRCRVAGVVKMPEMSRSQ